MTPPPRQGGGVANAMTGDLSVTDSSSSGIPRQLTQDQVSALDAARDLVRAGVPVFVAHPDPTSSTGFYLPPRWQSSLPDESQLDWWRPGDALAAVCGHGVDVIDVDPRNGGDVSAAALKAAGLWPQTYGRARTPSGGTHEFISGLRVAKGSPAAGIDLQAGAPDGTGRGFVFIAPTVRVSKTTGRPEPYTWEVYPNLAPLDPFGPEGPDDTGAALADIMRQRVRRPSPSTAPRDPNDPFGNPADLTTVETARKVCEAAIFAFRSMTDADVNFNARLNDAAMVIGHHVPAFMTYEQAQDWLYEAAEHNGSVSYQGARAVLATIRSGLLAGMSEPRERVESGGNPFGVVAPPEQIQGLRAELLTAAQLREQPNPEPLITGVLDLDTTAWLIGKAGSYKSFVVLDMLGHVATGRPWHGHDVRQGLCLYIVAEGVRGTKLRVAAWEQLNKDLGDQLLFLPRPVQVKDRDGWAALVAMAADLKPVFVVGDTQARLSVGLQENDNSEMMLYVNAMDEIRRATGACVLSVHHQGRHGLDARGASSIDGAQDAELRIERTEDRRVTIHMDKQKDADDTEKIDLELIRVEPFVNPIDPRTGRDLSSLVVVSAGTSIQTPRRPWFDDLSINQATLVGVFADFVPDHGATKAEISRLTKERTVMPHSSFARAWDGLISKEVILRVDGTQRWTLAPSRAPDDLS